MAHCPECGAKVGDTTNCPQCGFAIPSRDAGPLDPTRTLALGSPGAIAKPSATNASGPDASGAQSAPIVEPRANRTIVGMPAAHLAALTAESVEANPAGLAPANRTMIGISAAEFAGAAAQPADATPSGDPSAIPSQNRTMIGVAMPGIAPTAPVRAEEPPRARPRNEAPARELGATQISNEGAAALPPPKRRTSPASDDVFSPPRRASRPATAKRPPPRRAIAALIAAGALALVAVLFGLFWRGAPPITVLARGDEGGKDVLEVRCANCADGTQVTISGSSAVIADHVAQILLATPLSVGENLLKVSVDRPGSGRDEQVKVDVRVAYRIRPDLGTLQGDRPAIQVVVEALPNATVSLDGQPVALVNGHAIQTIDVTDGCTGLSDEQTKLSRQIPYVVTTPDGTSKGTVAVSVGIVPLHIDAPGPHAVTDGKSFVLAGRTLKGAELFAAGRPIPLGPNGGFAQVMNVSSVGATQIEVRAKLAGMAPRLTQIAVKRVDSLESAAAEFTQQPLVSYASLLDGTSAQVGKPIVLSGEVVEVRKQNHQTILLLDVSTKSGCTAPKGSSETCRVRLVQGSDSAAKSGDPLTAYGSVARTVPAGGKDIPEIQVDFTLKGLR
jgi:hypothetical protein